MSNVYIISDHHFDHKNIIEYENRPFDNVNDMNEYMITQWNSVVKKNDIVYHLGDFCFGNPDKFVNRLKGRKFLIMGNHDKKFHKNPSYWLEHGFEKVYDYPIIIDDIILSHEPIIYHQFPLLNIHGHMHTNYFTNVNYNNYYNVCVELHDYKPIPLSSIKIEEGRKC